MRNGKMKMSGTTLVVLILAVGFLAWYGNGEGWFDNAKSLSVAGGADPATVATAASIQPSLKVQPRNVYNDSTIGGSLTYWIDGAKFSGTAGTAFNVEAGKSAEVYFDDGQHYASRVTRTAPLNGEAAVAMDLYPNGTVSSVFFNSAGTAGSAQTLAAGDEKYVKVQLTATNKKVFSNPDSDVNPIGCFNYNTTAIDKIEVVGGSKAGVPQQAIGTYEECYFMPFTTLKNGGEYVVQLLVDADDTNAPAHDATMIVYDQDLYIKTSGDIGARAWGVENDLGTDIGGVNPTVTLDFTA